MKSRRIDAPPAFLFSYKGPLFCCSPPYEETGYVVPGVPGIAMETIPKIV